LHHGELQYSEGINSAFGAPFSWLNTDFC
jgi:hypothetical protein